LKGRRRDDLEKLLSIFDQSNRESNFHILNVDEKDFSEKEASIIRRLKAASKSKDVRAKMLGEDSLLNSWQNLEEAAEKAEEALAKAEEALEEAKESLEKKNEALAKTEEALEEEKRQKAAAEQVANDLQNKLTLAIQNLASKGFSVSEIAQMLGILEQDVQKVVAI